MQTAIQNQKGYGKVIKEAKSVLVGLIVNVALVLVKVLAGIFGSSYALIADGIESAIDVFTSLLVLIGLKLSRRPADRRYPYGHGKIEPLTAMVAALSLLAASIIIAVESIHAILTPHSSPAPFTLIVLLLTIFVKEMLFRANIRVGETLNSTAIKAEAWHHRSDAFTSAAAFIGISVALVGGAGYESSDDFAALLAAGVIAVNSLNLFKPALFELLDAAPEGSYASRVREIAQSVEGVMGTHKCHVRKVGFDYYVELDVLCDSTLTIKQGHEIAHRVGESIHAKIPSMAKVLVHVEPIDDYGRRSKNTLGE